MFVRGMEIIQAWVAWKEAVAKGEERSGMAAANAADAIASDRFDAIAAKLVMTPAATIEGVMAKARATANVFGENVSGECLRNELRVWRPDDFVEHRVRHHAPVQERGGCPMKAPVNRRAALA